MTICAISFFSHGVSLFWGLVNSLFVWSRREKLEICWGNKCRQSILAFSQRCIIQHSTVHLQRDACEEGQKEQGCSLTWSCQTWQRSPRSMFIWSDIAYWSILHWFWVWCVGHIRLSFRCLTSLWKYNHGNWWCREEWHHEWITLSSSGRYIDIFGTSIGEETKDSSQEHWSCSRPTTQNPKNHGLEEQKWQDQTSTCSSGAEKYRINIQGMIWFLSFQSHFHWWNIRLFPNLWSPWCKKRDMVRIRRRIPKLRHVT